MTLQGITQNYAGLLITRAFLVRNVNYIYNRRARLTRHVSQGITEAGFFPAAIYILSNWYLRNEMFVSKPYSIAT